MCVFQFVMWKICRAPNAHNMRQFICLVRVTVTKHGHPMTCTFILFSQVLAGPLNCSHGVSGISRLGLDWSNTIGNWDLIPQILMTITNHENCEMESIFLLELELLPEWLQSKSHFLWIHPALVSSLVNGTMRERPSFLDGVNGPRSLWLPLSPPDFCAPKHKTMSELLEGQVCQASLIQAQKTASLGVLSLHDETSTSMCGIRGIT